MNIGVNMTVADSAKTGIGTYAVNLVEQMLILDEENRYFIFVSGDLPLKNVNPERHHVINVCRNKGWVRRILAEQFILPFLVKKHKIEMLHSVAFSCPVIKLCKYVLTIHDLAYRVFPETVRKSRRVYYSVMFPLFASIADKIITVSENTKNDVIRCFHVPGDRIDTVLLGVSGHFRQEDDSDARAVLSSLGITGEYLLYVGSLEPRKNLVRLLQAFELIRKEVKISLVIVGPKGWMYDGIFSSTAVIEHKDDIIFAGHVEDQVLPKLYSQAKAFVFPSLYEGFGLPALEAMACGAPLIASGTSSLREVCGDAAIYVDPFDVKNIFENIFMLVKNDQRRAELREKGLERSRQFSWEKTARMTLEAYKKVSEFE
jgi:glycosyltransferase involved in cell wall biosynthesis